MNTIRLIYLQLFVCLIASSLSFASVEPNRSEWEAGEYLKLIHAHLALLYGSFQEEYPEQIMATMFISPEDKVLEIGGNVGRNSCVISLLLNNSQNLVVAESDPGAVALLLANRNNNDLCFHIEDSAISQVPLFQGGWVTSPLPCPNCFQVKTITYGQLKAKYGIPFSVLVADCEGALYYIFQDDETLLNDVSMVIVENDYSVRAHYEDVCSKFAAHGFHLVYTKSGGWGPCSNEFYQVWKKL